MQQGESDGSDHTRTPREILECFEGLFVEKGLALPDEIWSLGESQIEAHFKPTTNDFLIRKRLHQMVAKNPPGAKINSIEIFRGICTSQNFYTHLVKNQLRIAWYLLPIKSYEEMIEEGAIFAIKKLRDEILTLPVTDKNVAAILKAAEFFVNRHYGPVVQRIEQKSMNLNVNRTEKDVSELQSDDLMQKLTETKSKMKALPEVRDVNDPE